MRLLIFLCLMGTTRPPVPTGEQILRQMYERYHQNWYSTLTFVQKTEKYHGDSLLSTTVWHEAVMFPDKFRIDFGPAAQGDAVIFRHDSVYRFKEGKLVRSIAQINDLTFLLGGLYFMPFDSALAVLEKLHYDVHKSCQTQWHGRPVYIIGANKPEEKVSQLWIDPEKLVLVRFLKYSAEGKEEGQFEHHIPVGHGWTETACTFYIDDQLVQKEFYSDCKGNEPLDPLLFEPGAFGQVRWFQDN